MTRVRKAVIPAAGLGSRFLPATKAVPKEMVPLVDRPVIQHVVEEAVAAGVDDILVITGPAKRPIEDHFDRSVELERDLEARGKTELAARVRAVSELARIHTIRQGPALGLGHAVAKARDHVGDQPFLVMLPDDIVVRPTTLIEDMLAAHQRHGRPVIALRRVEGDAISAYGCAAVEPVDGPLVRITEIIEKPTPAQAPSELAVFGRYVFGPEVFDALDRVAPGAGGEIQLTDAIALLAASGEVHGWSFDGLTHDTGTPLGFLQAAVGLALDDGELGPPLREHLRRLLGS